MKKTISILCFATISLMALSLNESVDLALINSTKLNEIKLNKDIKKLSKEEIIGLQLGEISLVGSYDYYNLPRTLVPLTPASITPNIATTDGLFSLGLNYSVALFTGFAQTKSIEIEELQENSAVIIENLTKEQIIYNVKNIYLSILSLNEQLGSLNEYLKAQNAFIDVIKEEVKLGKKAYIDELKAKSDLESIKANRQTILANIDILKASLKYFIDKDVGTLEDVQIEVVKIEFDTSNVETLDRLQLLDLSLKAIDKKVEIKESAYYPQVSLNGYYGQNFGFNDSTNANEGDFNSEGIWQIGVKLKYNLYDFGTRSASLESVKLQKLQTEIKKDDAKREILKDITTALSKLNESISNHESSMSQFELLKESAEIEKVRYESGSATINDLLFVNAQKEQAKSKMIDAKYSYKKAIYFVEYILERGNK